MFHFLARVPEDRFGFVGSEPSRAARPEYQALLGVGKLEEGLRKPARRTGGLAGLVLGILVLGGNASLGPTLVSAETQDAGLEVVAEPDAGLSVLYQALSRCRGRLSETQRWQIAGTIDREARRYGYDPLFVQAMIEVESTCFPRARSRKGALGLIQLRPTTARAVAKEVGLPWTGAEALYDPAYNVRIGLHYLSKLHARFGDPHTAIAAYNLGPTRVSRLGSERVRNSRYVRRVLERYESLLREHQARPGKPA